MLKDLHDRSIHTRLLWLEASFITLFGSPALDRQHSNLQIFSFRDIEVLYQPWGFRYQYESIILAENLLTLSTSHPSDWKYILLDNENPVEATKHLPGFRLMLLVPRQFLAAGQISYHTSAFQDSLIDCTAPIDVAARICHILRSEKLVSPTSGPSKKQKAYDVYRRKLGGNSTRLYKYRTGETRALKEFLHMLKVQQDRKSSNVVQRCNGQAVVQDGICRIDRVSPAIHGTIGDLLLALRDVQAVDAQKSVKQTQAPPRKFSTSSTLTAGTAISGETLNIVAENARTISASSYGRISSTVINITSVISSISEIAQPYYFIDDHDLASLHRLQATAPPPLSSTPNPIPTIAIISLHIAPTDSSNHWRHEWLAVPAAEMVGLSLWKGKSAPSDHCCPTRRVESGSGWKEIPNRGAKALWSSTLASGAQLKRYRVEEHQMLDRLADFATYATAPWFGCDVPRKEEF